MGFDEAHATLQPSTTVVLSGSLPWTDHHKATYGAKGVLIE
jgi:hypothetical protein